MLFPDYCPVHISIYREDSLMEGLICKNELFPRDFAELTNLAYSTHCSSRKIQKYCWPSVASRIV